jgi:hypothetical protein
MGSQSTFPHRGSGVFEFGFSDAILQMWASFLAERDGGLDGRFGCVTQRGPDEPAHFQAVIESDASQGSVFIT